MAKRDGGTTREKSNPRNARTKGSLPGSPETIGLIPAAGLASRLGRLAGSKELLPVGWHSPDAAGHRAPRAAACVALEALRRAGIERAFVIIREGKWDIPAHLQDGAWLGVRIGYLLMGLPHGAAFTLDQAYPFVREARVALAFPDILLDVEDPFTPVLDHQARTGAEVVLGLFPAAEPARSDMVALEGARIRDIEVKPPSTHLTHTWGVAVWTPAFTRFLHERLATLVDARGKLLAAREVHIGDVVREAIEAGLRVEGVHVSERPYLDIGTSEGYRAALARLASPGGPTAMSSQT